MSYTALKCLLLRIKFPQFICITIVQLTLKILSEQN